MGKAKSKGKTCKGCKVKYGRLARLRKLTEDDISGLLSGLKGKVIAGDLLCTKCYGGQPTILSNSILNDGTKDALSGKLWMCLKCQTSHN